MPAKKKAEAKKSALRAVVRFDGEGTIDKTYANKDGMKTMQILNANQGLLVRFFDKDAGMTEAFLPVDEIQKFILAQ